MKTLSVVALCVVIAAGATYWAWRMPVAEHFRQASTIDAPDSGQPAHAGSHEIHDIPAAQNLDTDADPGCTIVRHYLPQADGTSVEAISCEPDSREEPHPYASYPRAALESLAYSDARAAEILGMRLIEEDAATSLSLVIRAAALAGGDPAPIRRYASAYPHPVFINGAPQPQTIRVKYVLASVNALLAGDDASPNPWEDVIRQYSSDPGPELLLLQTQAQDIVDEMRQIQLDVSGYSTIGGPGDA